MKKTLWILGAVIILLIIVVSVGTHKQSESYRVAALLCLTGDAATWGQNAQRAIQLAVDEANAKGGINGRKVEVIYEDTAADPKKAVSAFERVTSVEHVDAVIGPLNQTEVVALMPLITQKHIPTFVPGYVPLQNRSDLSNPILVWMDAEAEAGRMAQYVYDQGIRRVGVIGTHDSWETTVSSAFIARFKELGGVITDSEIVQPDSSEMKLPVTRVIGSKPEAIFLGTYYQFVNSTKVINNLAYKGKLFSIEVDGYLAEQSAQWVNSLQFVAPDYYNSAFVEQFKAKYTDAPGLPAGQAYDTTNILFGMLGKGGSPLDQMKSFEGYEGVSGTLKKGTDGRMSLPLALFDLNKGKITRNSPL